MFLSTIKYSWLREASHDQPVSGALNTTPNKMYFSFFNRVYHHALNLYFLLLRRILGRGTQEGGTHVYTELLLSSSRNQHNIVKRPHTLKGRKEGRGTRAKVRSPEEEQRSWPEIGAPKNNEKSRLQKNRQDQGRPPKALVDSLRLVFFLPFCFAFSLDFIRRVMVHQWTDLTGEPMQFCVWKEHSIFFFFLFLPVCCYQPRAF